MCVQTLMSPKRQAPHCCWQSLNPILQERMLTGPEQGSPDVLRQRQPTTEVRGQIETQSSRRTLMKEWAKVINQHVSPYLLHRQCCFTGSHMFVDLFHFLHKDFPVFGHLNGGHWRPQNRDFILLQDPLLGELHPAVQSRLTTEGQQHAVRSLILYHLRGEQGRTGVISENGIESKLRWFYDSEWALLRALNCTLKFVVSRLHSELFAYFACCTGRIREADADVYAVSQLFPDKMFVT